MTRERDGIPLIEVLFAGLLLATGLGLSLHRVLASQEEPAVFICPSTPDTNDCGPGLAPSGSFGAQPVSYAGMRWRPSPWRELADRLRRALPFWRDDDWAISGHGEAGSGAVTVLFLEGHVEFAGGTEIDRDAGGGRSSGLLWHLRN